MKEARRSSFKLHLDESTAIAASLRSSSPLILSCKEPDSRAACYRLGRLTDPTAQSVSTTNRGSESLCHRSARLVDVRLHAMLGRAPGAGCRPLGGRLRRRCRLGRPPHSTCGTGISQNCRPPDRFLTTAYHYSDIGASGRALWCPNAHVIDSGAVHFSVLDQRCRTG
jgi:hypothetical protein